MPFASARVPRLQVSFRLAALSGGWAEACSYHRILLGVTGCTPRDRNIVPLVHGPDKLGRLVIAVELAQMSGTRTVFLTAEWRDLVMLNYEVAPCLLDKYVPPRHGAGFVPWKNIR